MKQSMDDKNHVKRWRYKVLSNLGSVISASNVLVLC